MDTQILQPGFVLVGWTFLFSIQHFITQKRAANNREVEYKFFRVYLGDAPEKLRQSREHYKNLHQQPILFYFLLVGLAITKFQPFDLYLSWGYIVVRIFHSLVRELTNYVPHRFAVFAIGYLILVTLWVRWGLILFHA